MGPMFGAKLAEAAAFNHGRAAEAGVGALRCDGDIGTAEHARRYPQTAT